MLLWPMRARIGKPIFAAIFVVIATLWVTSGVAAIATLGATVAPPTPTQPSAVAEDALRTLTAERHGVIAVHESYSYREYGPAHNQTREVDSLRLHGDGRPIAVHLLAELSDGRAVSADQLSKDQREIDKHPPPEDYTLPLTSDALPQYRFTTSSCNSCPAGSSAIAFTSLKRDTDHGDGIMVVDTATHHILRLSSNPAFCPLMSIRPQ